MDFGRIWLLDSYSILTVGVLKSDRENGEEINDGFPSFPVLKVLYKLFDEENALTDPRANGEDSSVGIVEIPLGCCLKLIEILLVSSHAIPPACRTVGQFYVSWCAQIQEIF
ncbi:unnamed protein product [Dracunculus medinensis]|uniref:E3 ubiquitin-protein ligase E3D n=1 Tax=Dracunculus medinensis TaxID=318479 RepID=A0A158Q2P6_DRAME|nr:unnamed protein product [Dracunculus medinensis]